MIFDFQGVVGPPGPRGQKGEHGEMVSQLESYAKVYGLLKMIS